MSIFNSECPSRKRPCNVSITNTHERWCVKNIQAFKFHRQFSQFIWHVHREKFPKVSNMGLWNFQENCCCSVDIASERVKQQGHHPFLSMFLSTPYEPEKNLVRSEFDGWTAKYIVPCFVRFQMQHVNSCNKHFYLF